MKKLIIILSILTISSSKNKMYCDIKGNVNAPGIYEIKEGYTIQNVINDAGGLKKNSYTDNINLSKKVKDEMVIYIFNKNEINDAKKSKNICTCSPIYKYIECEDEKTTEITTTTTTVPKTKTTPTTNSQKNTTTTTEKTITTVPDTTVTTTVTTVPDTTVTTTKQITTSVKNELNHKVNINTATIDELKTLKGLGESKAKKIVEYRNTFGKFERIEDILNVDGVGIKTFESIKEFIEI